MKRKIDVIAAFVVGFTLLACVPSTVNCQRTSDDKTRVASNVDDNAWKRFINRQIAAEVAGHRPPTKAQISWKEYWASWYDEIRISPGLPWTPSEFKTKEDMIRYIENRRTAHRLPSYL